MDPQSHQVLYESIGVIFCVFMSAFFSGTETALTALSKSRLNALVEENRLYSFILRTWLKKPGFVLSTILIGNNLVNILGSVLAGKIANFYLKDYADAVAVALMTFAVLIIGEVTPKTYAKLNPETFISRFLIFLSVFNFIFYPLSTLFSHFARFMVTAVGGPDATKEDSITQNDVEYFIKEGSRLGVFEGDTQAELLSSVLEFKETTVREIMIPRTDAHFMSDDTTIDEALQMVSDWGHSRVPVYSETPDDVKGVLYSKDLVSLLKQDEIDLSKSISSLMRNSLMFVPETQKINETLKVMQSQRNHLAIVVDEFGGTSGIITLEDILEELVGDILDEDDKDENMIHKNIDNFVVDAHIPISDLDDELGIILPEDPDYTSLGGFITHHAGEVPQTGYEMDYGNYHFKILESDAKHIVRVEIRNRILSEESC